MILLEPFFPYDTIWLADSFWYGHTDSYREALYGHGAFELCLPSLRIFYHNSLLRLTISHRMNRTPWWGRWSRHVDLEQYAVRTIRWLRHLHLGHCAHSRPDLYCPLLLGVSGLVAIALPILTRRVCSLCETHWCFWFGCPAAYHRLPHNTCKAHWFLVRWGRPLPTVTIDYHASLLSLPPFFWPLPATTSGDTHRRYRGLE